jgi:hypothetical protein
MCHASAFMQTKLFHPPMQKMASQDVQCSTQNDNDKNTLKFTKKKKLSEIQTRRMESGWV